MLNNQIIIFASAFALALILSILISIKKINIKFLSWKVREDKNNTFYFIAKIFAFIVFGLFVYRIIHNEAFELIVNKDRLFSERIIVTVAILRTMLSGAIFLLLISPWFNYRPYQNGAAVFGTFAYVMNILYYKENVQALLGIVKVPSHTPREIVYTIELAVGLALCLLYLFKRITDKDYKNILRQAILTPVFYIVFSVATPNLRVFENLFDLPKWCGVPLDFNKTHILLIISMILASLGLSILFRNVKDKKYLHAFLAAMALICLIDYISPMKYAVIKGQHWKYPLHLCNTGVFLMFVSFTVKSKPIFYFNYLVNILGAVFAIMMPDYEDTVTILGEAGLHFWINHMILFILPIVAVAGGFYERPKMKYVFYTIIVFIAYFVLVATLDAIWQDEVNFFFLNGDSIVDKFTWAHGIKDGHVVTFDFMGYNFRVYWLYWMLVFLFYIAFIFGCWFIFATLYQVSDGYADLITRSRNRLKEQKFLKLEMGGRDVSEPLHPENSGSVIIEGFSKVYQGETKKAVDNFNLVIKPGTVYGFLGHNGAGKSTTIKSLVGIQTITEGKMEINGYDIDLQPLEAKINIGYVSDNHTVYEHLTGREYINYVADLYLVSKEDRDERIDKYVKMFNLEDAIDREIKGYSHGMKQKIVVISSLIHNPKIWVLDEPLTGLDPTSSYQIKTIMKEYASKGNIVFFSSHVIDVVEKICDEICIINHGKLIGTWKIKELDKEGITLQDLYHKYVSYKDGV